MTSFTSDLLSQTPQIAGLDGSIVIAARRLHLTLGVMSLSGANADDASSRNTEQQGQTVDAGKKTLTAALTLLTSLRPRLVSLLAGNPLRIPLTSLDIMKPERNDVDRAHVCFVGPSEKDIESEGGRRLWAVCSE